MDATSRACAPAVPQADALKTRCTPLPATGSCCAGVDSPRLALGERDFVLYHRTLPWDHAPGALLLEEESGGHVRRPDGTRYRPGDTTTGLLAAADAVAWSRVRSVLLP